MFSQLQYRIKQYRGGGHYPLFAIGVGVAGAIALMMALGALERTELGILDQFIRWRPATRPDPRILVVTIDEQDIATAARWPISDATLASVVREVSQYEPVSIGLDIYRNFPIDPGSHELIETFESMPHVIGIESVIGETVAAHPTLAELGQTAAADLVVDEDGKVRRGLLSVISPRGDVKQGLAATLALAYLEAQGIEPEVLETRRLALTLGRSKITRFERNDGGYVNADTGGFQVLMNYRGDFQQFDSVSLTAVLEGQLTPERVRDRIVLVGSTAVSLNDLFDTPYSQNQQVAGVYIHAHIINQLLDAALDGQPFLQTVPDYMEWLWTCFWVASSVLASQSVLYSKALKSPVPMWQLIARLVGLGGGLGATGYGLLVVGWWLPVALPMVAMMATMTMGVGYRNQQLQKLAAFDELTKVANRRCFDQHLAEALKVHKKLSLILCDVDYFKAFNDCYGHPAGDVCLQKVAHAIELAVRDSDLVARYGGEEFVIVLPDTTPETSVEVAERIQQQVRKLAIGHEASQVSEWVTLSCGSASVFPEAWLSPLRLIEYADQALYEAKQAGRNRVVVSQWQSLQGDESCLDESPSGETHADESRSIEAA